MTYLDVGIGIYGGLFHITSVTQTFHVFIFLISSVILLLTAFYPRRIFLEKYSSLHKLLFNNLIYYRTKIINKMGEQYKIIEYPLILLFIITGSVFLISTSDLVSIFLSIELQSYGLYLLSSCFILLGTALLYANSGSTNLDGIYVISSLSDITYNNVLY